MPPNLPGRVIESLRRTVLLRDDAALTDGQLLEHYLRQRDETAFAALVHRHGAMVWGVCRRTLSQFQDAEDAFQATFLLLVRKAASIRPRARVGNWLHGVALRVAMSVRRAQARRRRYERPVGDRPESAATDDVAQRELQALLDAELARLPAKYRTAIVLCDLGGRTRKDVARQLGIPEGTLSGRLSRGRALLARRLARYGLAIAAAVLTEPAMAAPIAVVSRTIQIATGPAALVQARVSILVEGVLKSMLITKLRFNVVVLLLVALLGAAVGIGQWGVATDAGEQAGPLAQAPKPAPKPKDAAPAPNRATEFEVFRLRQAKAIDIVRTLQALLEGDDAAGLRIVADPGSNSVLVRAQRAEQYQKVAAIMERLDDAARDAHVAELTRVPKATVRVFTLKYAKAGDVAKTLQDLLQGDDTPGLRIAADPGSNSVLVRGQPEQFEEVMAILDRLEEAEVMAILNRLKESGPKREESCLTSPPAASGTAAPPPPRRACSAPGASAPPLRARRNALPRRRSCPAACRTAARRRPAPAGTCSP